MNRVEQSVSVFQEGFSCSQAILSTYGPDHGLDRETALRLGEGFVGGIAFSGETCGAVAAAVMVIGLKHGRTRAKDRKATGVTARAVREFLAAFASRNGTTKCEALLGLRIDTPAGETAARKKGLFSSVCVDAVRDAAEILEEVIEKGS